MRQAFLATKSQEHIRSDVAKLLLLSTFEGCANDAVAGVQPSFVVEPGSEQTLKV